MRAHPLPVALAGLFLSLLVNPSASAATTAPDWLNELNRVRVDSGLGVVTADSTDTDGMAHHIAYLVHDKAYQNGKYANLHDENPAAPHHTVSGQHAGETSVITFATTSATGAINAWLAAPVHAAAMLKPDLAKVGFYRDPVSGDAMLFTDGGLGANNPQVLYPGDGGTTHLTRFGGESPDPTKSCPSGYAAGKSGLPLFAILPAAPTSVSSATLHGPHGSVPVCTIDTNDFNVSADPVYGPTAGEYFANGLVLIIPKSPLVPGRYAVTLNPGGESSVSWSFTSDPTPLDPSLGSDVMCSFSNPKYASGKVQVGVNNPPDTTRPTTYRVTVNGVHKSVTVPDGKFGHTQPFTHLAAGHTYTATALGSDGTSASEKVKVAKCPAWYGVGAAGRGTISVAKHRLTQPISNARNVTSVVFTVKRSGMSTLRFKIKGKSSRKLAIGLHRHGTTKLTFLVGSHVLYHSSIRLP